MKTNHPIFLFLFLMTMFSATASYASQHNTEDYTPLFAAAESGDVVTIEQALQADANIVKVTAWDDETLLHDAVEHDQLVLARLLIDAGADVNAVTKEGVTPLDLAAQNGFLSVMTLLLDHGAHVDLKDDKGRTALDRAEQWDEPDAAAMLKQRNSKAD